MMALPTGSVVLAATRDSSPASFGVLSATPRGREETRGLENAPPGGFDLVRLGLRLEEGDSGCTVTWESDFQPSGAPENDAVDVITGVYQAGFDNLKKMFGG